MSRFIGTLPLYISKRFIFWIFFVFLSLSFLFALFDFVELMRRASGKIDANINVILQMSISKLPHLIQDIFPFIMLFGSLISFWRLSKTSELIVARAAGFSAWQLLRPALIIAFTLGLIQITAFGPLAASMYKKFEILENQFLKKIDNQLSLSGTGLWLRQGSKDRQEVIHAETALNGGNELQNVTVYLFQNITDYTGRIDAKSATLNNGYWSLSTVTIAISGEPLKILSSYNIPTSLTGKKIKDSFSSEDTLSFWILPRFIETLEEAGFDASNHKLRFHSLLATPFLFCAMVLIAAAFSIRVNQRRGASFLILGGIGCGFLLYFFTNVVHALGLSTGIPVWVAAWIPAGVSVMLGVTALLHTEDG